MWYTKIRKDVIGVKILVRCLALLMALAGPSYLLSRPTAKAQETDGVRLICLNIGKADCMLLLCEDEAWLIDTGYEHTYAALETMLSQYGVTHLNGVILTHCHEDHQGGLSRLAESDIQVDNWYAASIYFDVKENKHPAKLAAESRNTSVTWLDAGMQLSVGQRASLAILGPLRTSEENENNNSLVMRFSSPHGSILFAGDMKEEEEWDLIQAGTLKKSDVLKVGHHGDNKATSQNFLRVVQPRVSVILTSSFEEKDTPATATLARLQAAGSAAFVSQDAHDAIQITLNDGTITVDDISWGHVPAAPEGLVLSLDTKEDLAIIENRGGVPVNLSGFQLYSSKGEDSLFLPEFTLNPGESYRIGTHATNAPYDLKWDKKQIWHEKKRDMAILLDPYGRILARTDNGRPE